MINNVLITDKIKDFNNWRYIIFFIVGIIILGAIIFITNQDDFITGNVIKNNNFEYDVINFTIDEQPILGNKNAKITIVEFLDYQCPFSRKFWTETYPQIKKDYVDTGKVRFIFREFPLDEFHPAATTSSIAVECVRRYGGDAAYYKMHNKIFEEQNIMDSGDSMGLVTRAVNYTYDELKLWAKQIGYDIEKCFDNNEFIKEVEKDLNDGELFGVRGTPTFFINGKMISGAKSYSIFKKEIDSELSK